MGSGIDDLERVETLTLGLVLPVPIELFPLPVAFAPLSVGICTGADTSLKCTELSLDDSEGEVGRGIGG